MTDSGDIPGEIPDDEETGPSAAELEAAGQAAMFGDAAPPPAAPAPVSPPASTQPYRVLARKYRPQTFSELIGQEPMVQTLANAIRRERLAHAFLMTGVRGVGKTSTARLIAKALNCIGPDGQGGPTIDPCGRCEPCRAIAEGRHIDVIEMDAASHTGIDDVREIIEAVRYAAVSARYKMYIIDEAHMLSKQAWNGLLKTLEEPPPHVKFLFATTEAERVPVTVLSRCQRFDLRRIPADLLQHHFAAICVAEGVAAEAEALAMIAAAAEGSVRDGLSILDQAIAHADLAGDAAAGEAEGLVRAAQVQAMLGLADRSARRRLFAHLLEGDPQALLAAVEQQYAFGVEPLALLRSLLELVHRIAVAQIGGEAVDALSVDERNAISGWAERLNAGQVHRLWQLLLKGHDEVARAPDPLVAVQMALLRMLHAADLPDPGKLAKELRELAASAGAAAAITGGGDAGGGAAVASLDWAGLVAQVDDAGRLRVAQMMRDWVRVIGLEPGRLVCQLVPGCLEDPCGEIREALGQVTGQRWLVELGVSEGGPSLREAADAARAAQDSAMRSHPLVAAAFAAFPQAEFVAEKPAPRGQAEWNRRA